VASPPVEASGFEAPRPKRPGELFGHPTCLFTLFFAEMWERFSFYGMKALLILYMVNYLFWRQDEASHVMALYAGLVYATPVLGGIVADKVTGARWAVVIGGVIIATGHFLLAFEPMPFFYAGLVCLIIGTGFLKPNISTQVGALYRTDDERRDSAFTIFYMGINLGAFIGPLVCGWLRFAYSYHYGFAAAGVGMVLGLIVYIAGMSRVVRREKMILAEEAAAKTGGASGQPDAGNVTCPNPDCAEKNPAGAEFCKRCGLRLTAGPTAEEGAAGAPSASRIYLDRSIVLVVICIFAILFWVGFEQAANVMNLWADKHTNLHVFRGTAPMVEVADVQLTAEAADAATTSGGGIRNWQMTAEQSQSINPLFIIIFAGVFAFLWEFLDRRGKQPSTPMKMAFGVFFLSCAYGIMLMAAQAENQPTTVQLAQLPTGLQVDDENAVYRTVEEEDGTTREVYYGATRLRWDNGTLHMNGVLTDLDWMRALGATCAPEYEETIKRLAKAAEERAEEVRQAKQAGEINREAVWEVSVAVSAEAGDPVPVAAWPEHDKDRKSAPIIPIRWALEDLTQVGAEALQTEQLLNALVGVITDPDFRDCLADVARSSAVPAYGWDPDTGEREAHEPITKADLAQLLIAGADPEFRATLSEWYRESSAPIVRWQAETRTLSVTDTLSDKDQAQLLAGGADPEFRAALTAIYQQSSVVKISILWLLAFYLVLTIGELCLSPVGLSLVTKAAPPKYVGLFMGFWFLTTGAVSNYLAHSVGGYWGSMTPGHYFMIFGVLGVIATVIMLLLIRVLKPMLHGVH